jgi:hypothetical protein
MTNMNVIFPIAHFGPSNPSLSYTSQCIMRRFPYCYDAHIKNDDLCWMCDTYGREHTYIYGYGRKCLRNKHALKTGVQRGRLIKVRIRPHRVNTSDVFALLLPKDVKFLILSRRDQVLLTNTIKFLHILVTDLQSTRQNIVIEIYNRQPLKVDNLKFKMDHTGCSIHICYFSLRYWLTKTLNYEKNNDQY